MRKWSKRLLTFLCVLALLGAIAIALSIEFALDVSQHEGLSEYYKWFTDWMRASGLKYIHALYALGVAFVLFIIRYRMK